jgi:hypothetical protein
MTDHPISMPSPELAAKWVHEIYGNTVVIPLQKPTLQVIEHAVRWGADQELEACIDWMTRMGYWGDDGKAIPALRAARRPKPPSLKEQALIHFESFAATFETSGGDSDLIRRALEQLDD